MAEAGLAAAAEVGHPTAGDLSSGAEEGFGWCDLNIVAGQRQSAADAYLSPILGRPNLSITTDALVHRVMIDGERCTGVEYSIGRDVFSVRSSSEVVLTAGAVGSPQLLMLSGIGPVAHLREEGVNVAMNLPAVGSNLHDHPMSGVVYRSAKPVPAGANNHGEAMGLIRSNAEIVSPDVQIMFVDVPLRAGALPGPAIGDGYTVVVALMLPHSRGSIRLANHTPGTSPRIDPNYYSDHGDLDAMTAGLWAARTIGRARSLRQWCGHEVLPGPAVQDDATLHTYLRKNLQSYSHYGGTCRIGDSADGVVDIDLRVHGIERLRVADASVMPAPVSANTNATIYAIAERAAALIRGETTAPESSTAMGTRKPSAERKLRAASTHSESSGSGRARGSDRPSQPSRNRRSPLTPAYYAGRPAQMWINALSRAKDLIQTSIAADDQPRVLKKAS